ncbi:ashwin-like [Glandiceps talaboti]
MATTESMEVETVDLLHPEILSKETIIKILKSRCVRLDNMYNMDKDALVEVFHRTVLPMPQREFRDNRRGKIMAKLRPKKRKISDVEKFVKNMSVSDGGPAAKRRASGGSSHTGLITSVNITSTTERLKPPPIVINKNKTVVKLNPSKKDTEIKSVSSGNSSSGGGGSGRTIIKLNSNPSTPQSNHSKECKKVSLKRPSGDKSSTKEESPEHKKKISLKPILSPTSSTSSSSLLSTSPPLSSPTSTTTKSSDKEKVKQKKLCTSPLSPSSSSSSDTSPTKKMSIKKITWP